MLSFWDNVVILGKHELVARISRHVASFLLHIVHFLLHVGHIRFSSPDFFSTLLFSKFSTNSHLTSLLRWFWARMAKFKWPSSGFSFTWCWFLVVFSERVEILKQGPSTFGNNKSQQETIVQLTDNNEMTENAVKRFRVQKYWLFRLVLFFQVSTGRSVGFAVLQKKLDSSLVCLTFFYRRRRRHAKNNISEWFCVRRCDGNLSASAHIQWM